MLVNLSGVKCHTLYLSSGKEKESLCTCLVFTPYSRAVTAGDRSVQKSVMHVQSCFFEAAESVSKYGT